MEAGQGSTSLYPSFTTTAGCLPQLPSEVEKSVQDLPKEQQPPGRSEEQLRMPSLGEEPEEEAAGQEPEQGEVPAGAPEEEQP